MDGTVPHTSERRAVSGLRRWLVILVALALVPYVGAMVWLVVQETEIVFSPARELGTRRPPFAYQQVDLPRSDGARQFAWIMPQSAGSDGGPWVLYLHGNAASIAARGNVGRYAQLHGLGLNILAPEYRGYGGLDGVPSEAALAQDARAAYEYLRREKGIPADRIIFYGWSLGSAVAVTLAAEVPQAAVILEGAPASLVDIGQQMYPLFPIRLLMRNPFESILRVDRIDAPVLFLHSPEDTVIPIAEGRRLFEAVRAPRTFVEVRGGHIRANEVDSATFVGAIRTFLRDLRLLSDVAASPAS